MSYYNPFTPAFGGRPDHFFGRTNLLGRVRDALEGEGDTPDRVLFITGPRGCGKTALLEHMSRLAKEVGWLTVDVHSVDAVQDIALGVAQRGSAHVTFSPEIKAFGASLSLGEVDHGHRATIYEGLTAALLERFATLGKYRGIFITIDEIQKISERDMEQVCNAVQMARRKGNAIALMLAGLPGSKERVASYRGCTFMQRASDEQIGSLLVGETVDAFAQTLARVKGLESPGEVVRAAAECSQGYPYLIQLVGYHLVEHVRKERPIGEWHLNLDDVQAVFDDVYTTYRQNVLVPSTRALGSEARAYLASMAVLLDERGAASTGDVAQSLGKTTPQLSSCRQNLIDRRLIRSAGFGKVRFCLPYLSRFSLERESEPSATDVGPDEWIIR